MGKITEKAQALKDKLAELESDENISLIDISPSGDLVQTPEDGQVWVQAINKLYDGNPSFSEIQDDIANQFYLKSKEEGYDEEVSRLISNGFKKIALGNKEAYVSKEQFIYNVLSGGDYKQSIVNNVEDQYFDYLYVIRGADDRSDESNIKPEAGESGNDTEGLKNDDIKAQIEEESRGKAPPTAGGTTEGEKEYSRSDFVNAVQCALLSDLKDLALFRRSQCFINLEQGGYEATRQDQLAASATRRDKENFNLQQRYSYKNRIANFMTTNPENLINRLVLSDSVAWKGRLPSSWFDTLGTYFEVFKVTAEGEELYVPNKLGTGDTNELRQGFSAKEFSEQFPDANFAHRARLGELGVDGIKDIQQSNIQDVLFYLKNADISYEGGTPATARSDVEVTLTYAFKGLQILDTPFYVLETKRNEEYVRVVKKDATISHRHKPVDLILFPMGASDTLGVGRLFKKQYDPNYTRIRIKYGSFWDPSILADDTRNYIFDAVNKGPEGYRWNTEDGLEWDEEACENELKKIGKKEYHLDLNVVDHELTLKEDGNKDEWELKITYRGYTQSLITSPLMDAMQTEAELEEKITAENELVAAAIEKKCSAEAMRRLYGDFNQKLLEMTRGSHQKLLHRLILRGKVVSVWAENKVLANLVKGQPTGKQSLLTSAEVGFGVNRLLPWVNNNSEEDMDEHIVGKVEGKEGKKTRYTGAVGAVLTEQGSTHIPFFYIGDLIEVATDSIYRFDDTETLKAGRTNTHVPINIKFVCGCFKYYDPITKKDVLINISEIPISVPFFQSWWHDTVIKNKKAYYPIGTFIRDLCEVAVSNLLAEVCFGPTMEPKLMFGTTYMQGQNLNKDMDNFSLRSSYHKFGNETFNEFGHTSKYAKPLVKIQQSHGAVASGESGGGNSKKRRVAGHGLESVIPTLPPTDKNLWGYFVIYPHSNNAFSMDNDGSDDSMEKNFVPYLPFGVSVLEGPVDKIGFSKVDTPGLREARYFNSSQNGLTMLANVYDVTINTDAVFDYFPGGLIYIDPVDLSHNSAPGFESHPYESGALAHHMGLGGYHVITKSTINFSNLEGVTQQTKCVINAKWVYSGNPEETRRIGGSRSITKPMETKACIEHLQGETAQRVDEVGIELIEETKAARLAEASAEAERQRTAEIEQDVIDEAQPMISVDARMGI